MNGKQAKALRRMARALTVGQPFSDYELEQQRDGFGQKCGVKVAESPLSTPENPQVLRAVSIEHGTTKYGQWRRVKRITGAPLVLSYGKAVRLAQNCQRSMYQALKRNYRRLRTNESSALVHLRKIRGGHA